MGKWVECEGCCTSRGVKQGNVKSRVRAADSRERGGLQGGLKGVRDSLQRPREEDASAQSHMSRGAQKTSLA